MSARNPCSIMVAGETKSFALSSLRGKSGTFMIPAYSAGGLPPTAWVISAVIVWLGRVLRSVQESPPSSETKMGAVALAEPPGFGVKRSEEHTSELQSQSNLVCRLLLEKKNINAKRM